MHEMSIAASLLDRVLDVAGQNNACRVDELTVEVGVLQQVVPEALRMAFAAVTEGTIAQGATLNLVECPASAECRCCGERFDAAIDDYACPRCRQADVRIVAGRDIVLKTVVCQTPSGLTPG
jgi:hydrogenase nickel incorporation protein HypA/HybF